MSKLGSVFTVNDSTGVITTPSVDAGSIASGAADGTGVTVNGSTGKLELTTAGTSLASGVQRDEMSKFAGAYIVGDLVASDAAGGIMSVENTYGTDLVADLTILITTETTGACTADFGQGSSGSTSYDNLIDGTNLQPAAGSAFVRSSVENQEHGTNGRARVLWKDGEFITGSMASGAAAGLVGRYCIRIFDMN